MLQFEKVYFFENANPQFEREHLETELSFSRDLTTFLKYHMPLTMCSGIIYFHNITK